MDVNIHQAKTHLSRLLQRVAEGEEITIARAGVPVAKLVAVERRAKVRPLNMDRGRVWVADDFDAPLPDDLMAAFMGESSSGESSHKPAVKRGRKRK